MAAEGKSEVVIEVCADLEACLQSELPPAISPVDTKHPATATIFRVPPNTSFSNEGTYKPQYVSIGPYHFSAGSDSPTRAIKLQALRALLSRSGLPLADRLEDYAAIAFRRLGDVKSLYGGEIEISDSDLVWMLVTDGCFIIEFLTNWYLNDPHMGIKTESKKSDLPVIRRDLLLVENQIPFFILHDFFQASTIPELAADGVGLMELALAYLSGDRAGAQIAAEYYRNSEHKAVEIQHLLHLYHLVCLDPDFAKRANEPPSIRMLFDKLMTGNSISQSLLILPSLARACMHAVFRALFLMLSRLWWLIIFRLLFLLAVNLGVIRNVTRRIARRGRTLPAGIPSASYLRDTGFKFRRKEPLSSFSYVTIRGKHIEIPALSMDLTPPAVLMNLLIYERCHPTNTHSVAGFLKLMDYLVDTAEDVAILKESGIIDGRVGDYKYWARRFSRLCQDFSINDDHYLQGMFSYVRGYYDRNYDRVMFYQWRKKLIPDYFSNPWAVPSMTAAFIALILTFASTFYTIYAYYHPRS